MCIHSRLGSFGDCRAYSCTGAGRRAGYNLARSAPTACARSMLLWLPEERAGARAPNGRCYKNNNHDDYEEQEEGGRWQRCRLVL